MPRQQTAGGPRGGHLANKRHLRECTGNPGGLEQSSSPLHGEHDLAGDEGSISCRDCAEPSYTSAAGVGWRAGGFAKGPEPVVNRIEPVVAT